MMVHLDQKYRSRTFPKSELESVFFKCSEGIESACVQASSAGILTGRGSVEILVCEVEKNGATVCRTGASGEIY